MFFRLPVYFEPLLLCFGMSVVEDLRNLEVPRLNAVLKCHPVMRIQKYLFDTVSHVEEI
jgi:hypothetical protein